MSIQIDIFANFDRELTGPELKALETALREQRMVNDNLDEVHEHGLTLLYQTYDEMCTLRSSLTRWLPPDVTTTLELHYRSCEEPGVEFEFYGPKAEEYEIEHCTREIRALQSRIEAAEQRIANRGA